MPQLTLPARILPNLIDMAIKNRINVAALFEKVGIDPELIGKGDAFITLEQFDALFHAASELSEDPAFGLHVGESNQYTNLDILGNLIATSATLRDAINELIRFKDLVAPHLVFTFTEGGDTATLAFSWIPGIELSTAVLHNEIALTTIVTIGNSLVEEDLDIREVHFTHPEPAYIEEYQRIFKAPVKFSQQTSALIIGNHSLDIPLATAYPQYHQRVEKIATEQLSKLSKGKSTATQVWDALEHRIGHESIAIDDIARLFNTTARTLQRRLKAEETSFAKIREELRHQIARNALRDPDTDIESLAAHLGFSDASNFYHAFKRWEGKSPGEYRKSFLKPEANSH